MSTTAVPMPGHVDPDFEEAAPFVKQWLREHGQRPVVIMEPRDEEAVYGDRSPFSVASPPIALTVQKAYGPAPFVGDVRTKRGGYFWLVATDERGRSIAGDAWLEIWPEW